MRTKRAKSIRVIDRRLFLAIIFGFILLLIISGIFMFLHNRTSKSISSVSIVKAVTSDKKVERIKSAYLEDSNRKYEKTKEQQAKQTGESYVTIGSINAISPVVTKLPTLNSTKPYNYDEARRKRENQTIIKPPKKEQNTSSLSYLFLKELAEAEKAAQSSRPQKVQFQTVVTPTYFDSVQTLSNKKKSALIIGKITAGTTLYGILINNINSDFKTPVVAHIIMGKYKDATLIGGFDKPNQWVDGISIVFNKMLYDGIEFPIQAIATNADYEPNLYDSINHHWFQRIGGMIAGAALGATKGAAKAFEGSNQPVAIVSGGGEASIPSNSPSTKQIAFTAAGGAATDVSTQLKPVFTNMWNRPTTIKVKSGHAIGILFTNTAIIKEKS